MIDLLDLLGHGLLFQAVRGPRELVEAVVEIIRDVGAGLAPGFGGFRRKIHVKVGREDGLVRGRVHRVAVGVESGGVTRGIVGAGSAVVVGWWLGVGPLLRVVGRGAWFVDNRLRRRRRGFSRVYGGGNGCGEAWYSSFGLSTEPKC